jgi:hypothetical protein
MASLWEIFDTSNLRYNTDLGATDDDSGFGPPSGVLAWIRTGFNSVGIDLSGFSNCNAWTDGTNANFGSFASPDREWTSPGFRASPWTGGTLTCNHVQPVWCVQD